MKKQQGQVIIILLLLMLVALSVGLALTQRSITDVATSTQVEQSSRAFSAAEAGLEKALSGSVPQDGKILLGNNSEAVVQKSIFLPISGTFAGIEYPPVGRETTAQFWFVDPAVPTGPTTLSSGLQAYYGLDDNVGTSVTNSTGGPAGVLNNASAWINPGKIKNAVAFNGATFINAGSTLTNLATGPFTAGAWFKTTNAGLQLIVGNRGNGSGWRMYYEGGRIACQIYSSDSTYMLSWSTATWTPSDWNYVTCTWNAIYPGGQLKVYINGQEGHTEQNQSPVASVTGANTFIGASSGTPTIYHVQGAIDEVGLWNRILTAPEISALALGQVPPSVVGTGASYGGSNVDLYFGNENTTTDKPAVEVAIVTQGTSDFYTNTYYYDSDNTRSGTGSGRNGFTQASCSSIATLGNGILGKDSNFLCKVRISNITSCPSGTCKPILARIRLLYSSENHKIALAPVGANVQFPPQVQIYSVKGTSGQSEKQIQAFKIIDVVPPWFDFAVFSVNEIIK